MTSLRSSSIALAPEARNVGRARKFVRDALLAHGAEELVEASSVVVSELVTNAFVHAGTAIEIRVAVRPNAIRVEVLDGSDQVPKRRHYAQTAGTGRGLQLVEELVTRWGVQECGPGKTVWFEIGEISAVEASSAAGTDGAPSESRRAQTGDDVSVTLRNVPLLMHFAWQEHAATLLREYLLYAMDQDDHIFTKHAHASEAMTLLGTQLPVPALSEDPNALMADAVEPRVTEPEQVLSLPRASVPRFAILDQLLGRAIAHARAGRFLSPPTQPEIDEMRQWLCREVARQSDGDATATPWLARTDVRATMTDQAELHLRYGALAAEDSPLLATDEASIIVAASPPALDLLGYENPDQLVGRRVIVVVPERFHQAHIAGTTLNATNGRSVLLGVPVTVPMTRADGTELAVRIEVRPHRVDPKHRVFIARFQAA